MDEDYEDMLQMLAQDDPPIPPQQPQQPQQSYNFNAYDTNIPYPRNTNIFTQRDLLDEIRRLTYQYNWYQSNVGNRTPSGYAIPLNTLSLIQNAIQRLQITRLMPNDSVRRLPPRQINYRRGREPPPPPTGAGVKKGYGIRNRVLRKGISIVRL